MKFFGSRVGSQTGTHATHPFPSLPGPLNSIKWILRSSSVNTSSDTLVFVWVTYFGGITIWNYLLSLSQQLGYLLKKLKNLSLQSVQNSFKTTFAYKRMRTLGNQKYLNVQLTLFWNIIWSAWLLQFCKLIEIFETTSKRQKNAIYKNTSKATLKSTSF